jgi:hypothetical protein
VFFETDCTSVFQFVTKTKNFDLQEYTDSLKGLNDDVKSKFFLLGLCLGHDLKNGGAL